jgi:hypothetical protein
LQKPVIALYRTKTGFFLWHGFGDVTDVGCPMTDVSVTGHQSSKLKINYYSLEAGFVLFRLHLGKAFQVLCLMSYVSRLKNDPTHKH